MQIKLTQKQQERANALAQMSPSEWDSVCKQCGICCLEKFEMPIPNKTNPSVDDTKVLYLKRCCDKFDTKTCKCSVYQTRLNNPNCAKVTMNLILNTNILPASCGYVEYIFGPAKFPAHVDFNQIRPFDDNDEIYKSPDKLSKAVIAESVLWNERSR